MRRVPRDAEYDDFPEERAYDSAVRQHAKNQAWEDKHTGMTLDPPPPFGESQDDDLTGDEPTTRSIP